MNQKRSITSSRTDRWQHAQESESLFWQRHHKQADKVMNGLQNELNRLLTCYGLGSDNFVGKTILDVGCGPWGMIYVLEGHLSLRIGIDPLAVQFKQMGFPLDRATYLSGIGENLPIRSNSVDFVVSRNVLDHTLDPALNLCEIYRVLTDRGKLLLYTNVIPNTLHPLAPALSQIDSPHPHHFSVNDIEHLLKKSRIKIEMKELGKVTLEKPRWSKIFFPSQYKYIFAWYVMSALYIVGTKE